MLAAGMFEQESFLEAANSLKCFRLLYRREPSAATAVLSRISQFLLPSYSSPVLTQLLCCSYSLGITASKSDPMKR